MNDFETQKSTYLELAKVNGKIFLSPWIKVPGVQGIDFFCIQLLFWRHHQWIARQLKKYYPTFDDERLYQITKMCNIVTCMQITLSLYGIMGIVQSNVSHKFDYYDFENLYNSVPYKFSGPSSELFPCNSTNVYIEFNFMYRWHQLIPPIINILSNDEYLKLKPLTGRTANVRTDTTAIDNYKRKTDIENKSHDDTKKDNNEEDLDDMQEFRLPYKNYVKN